ncbi:MAG: DUF2378 family protein [Myxococcaceae bacterium]|nr:MAG: DUF2378 family protein [Myxococcaceae bacterium]
MPEKLVFEHTLEGLFIRGLAGQLTPELRGRLRTVGVDLDRKLQPAYGFDTWCSAVHVSARLLHADLPDEVALARLGERMVDGYRATLLGRALFGVLQLMGPRRGVSRAQQMFRSGNNYTQTRMTDLSPTSLELWMNEAGFIRFFTQGALLAGLRATGAAEPRVDVHDFTAEDVTYRVSWKDADAGTRLRTSTPGDGASRGPPR